MADNGDGLGDYVRQARESTTQYARDLLAENEKLTALNASLSADRKRLEQDLGTAIERDKHNEELRAAVEALVAERVRLIEQSRSFRDQLSRERGMHSALVQQLAVNSNLANLYVASFRLHGCLDRESVLATMQEIVINIIGSEQFAIFELDSDGISLRLASSFGVDDARAWGGGTPAGKIAETVREGVTYVAPPDQEPGDSPLACVPLKIGDKVIGAVAIFRLLEHKAHLESLDHELFNLLATHAATALYCSELHARFGHRWREQG